MSYISVSDVRISSGAPSSLIPDADITHAISIVEPQVERLMNTKFTPTHRIDVLDGVDKDRIYTDKNPLLKVKSLKSNDSSITASSLIIDKGSGRIRFGDDSEASQFLVKAHNVIIEYYFAYLIEDEDNRTTTNGAVTAGSSIDVIVDDAQSFAEDDWVEIYGTDGYREVAKITTVSGTTMTVDNLIFGHVDESIFVKQKIPEFVQRYMELEASIYVAIAAIGATYTFNASYQLADLQVTKGVPYTHWRESVEKCIKERETLRKRIKPRFCIR